MKCPRKKGNGRQAFSRQSHYWDGAKDGQGKGANGAAKQWSSELPRPRHDH